MYMDFIFISYANTLIIIIVSAPGYFLVASVATPTSLLQHLQNSKEVIIPLHLAVKQCQ